VLPALIRATVVKFSLPPSGRRRTVLIVDDDRSVRELFREALRIEGFDVRSASDGISALWQIDQQVPDAVILDLELPQVTGVDLLRELRSRPDMGLVPVIIVTGTDWEVPLDVAATLHKPVRPETLVSTLERAMTKSPFA
jgi:DNA-binding response OmpR family regulator